MATKVSKRQVFIGIDPAIRHTGLCALWYPQLDQPPVWDFDEIKTEGTILTSLEILEKSLWGFLTTWTYPDDEIYFSVERQLTSGQTSPMLFAAMMSVLKIIARFEYKHRMKNPKVLMVLPVQLKSYIGLSKKSDIVAKAKKELEISGRISSHKADAYFLAKAVIDVLRKKWKCKRAGDEASVIPWKTLNTER